MPSARFEVIVAEGDPAFEPLLTVLRNLHSFSPSNPTAVPSLITQDGWRIQSLVLENSAIYDIFFPRASFSSFELHQNGEPFTFALFADRTTTRTYYQNALQSSITSRVRFWLDVDTHGFWIENLSGNCAIQLSTVDVSDLEYTINPEAIRAYDPKRNEYQAAVNSEVFGEHIASALRFQPRVIELHFSPSPPIQLRSIGDGIFREATHIVDPDDTLEWVVTLHEPGSFRMLRSAANFLHTLTRLAPIMYLSVPSQPDIAACFDLYTPDNTERCPYIRFATCQACASPPTTP